MSDNDMQQKDLEVAIAVIQEQMRTLLEDSKEARHARKNQYMAQEQLAKTLMAVEHRLDKFENFVTGASPTLAEFNALKLKAEGAGTLGKWLWFLAGFSISAVAAIVAFVNQYWPNKP